MVKKRKSKNKHKSQLIRKVFFILLAVLCGLTYKYRYELRDFVESYIPVKYIKHKEFGIYMPPKYSMNGIDVSRYQGKINWQMVKEMRVDDIQINFVFIKATEGRNHTDSRFKYNWKHARKNKLVRGAYHYFSPNISGEKQAKHFIKKVKLWKGDLPPVLDIEVLNGQNKTVLVREIKKWLSAVENHYKIKPIVYTYSDFHQQNLKNSFKGYPLWIAHYHVRNPKIKQFAFWQHSDKGRVAGIKSLVDFNVYKGDLKSFRLLLKK